MGRGRKARQAREAAEAEARARQQVEELRRAAATLPFLRIFGAMWMGFGVVAVSLAPPPEGGSGPTWLPGLTVSTLGLGCLAFARFRQARIVRALSQLSPRPVPRPLPRPDPPGVPARGVERTPEA